MANITLPATPLVQNFDDDALSALGNGQTITYPTTSTVTLIQNSDSRWSKQGAVVGSISTDQILGGTYLIDGTTVWWLPYSGGSGNVPTRGTIISGSSSNAYGELLCVFSAMGVNETSAGTMPSTGYIKLRSKIGNFIDNESLVNITATTSGVGQRGWIHFVGAELATINVRPPDLSWFITSGDWFNLGTTNGVSGQTIQYYIYDVCPTIFIETSPGSNQYDPYLNISELGWVPVAADGTSGIGTDYRHKYISCSADGIIRIGASRDGQRLGYLPVSGCNIRVPNIHVGSAPTTNYNINNINTTIGSRYDINTTLGGSVYFSKTAFTWGFTLQYYTSAIIKDCSSLHTTTMQGGKYTEINNFYINDYGPSTYAYAQSLYFRNNENAIVSGVYAVGVKKGVSTNAASITIDQCRNSIFANIFTSIINRSATTQDSFNIGGENNIIYNLSAIGARITTQNNRQLTISGLSMSDAQGSTIIGGTIRNIVCGNTGWDTDIILDNITIMPSGTPANNAVFYFTDVSNFAIRNVDFSNIPYMPALMVDGGYSYDVKLQNIKFPTSAGSTWYTGSLASNGCIFQNIDTSNFSATSFVAATTNNNIFKGSIFGNDISQINTNFTSNFGIHFYDCYTSNTTGRIGICFTPKSTNYYSNLSYEIVSGSPTFNYSGRLYFNNTNDAIEYTIPWYIKGHTGFSASNPECSQSDAQTRIDMYYDIDKNDGNGFTNAWTVLSASTISAETISPTDGFRLKIKLIRNSVTPSTVAYLDKLTIKTLTTSSDRQILYPYESVVATLTLSNLISGSEVKIFQSSNDMLLAGDEAITGTTFTYDYLWEDNDINVYIVVFALGYQPIRYTNQLLGRNGLSLYIVQQIDRVFSNP